MLHYKPKHEKDNASAYLPECCEEVVIDDPKGCDCCADNWTKDLKVTVRNYKEWSARAEKLNRLYTLRVGWRDKLKAWYDDMTRADEKSDDLLRQVELFINHLTKICLITEETTKAIKYLFCMVEDLYIRVDKLKDSYDELMTCINTAKKTHPELEADKGIVKCLEEYGKKLMAVTATRDAIIRLFTKALEQIYLLHENLCLEEENCGQGKPGDHGLINIIMYWRDVLNGSIDVNHGKCIYKPFISFPIDESDYYKKLKKDWDDTRQEVEQIKVELDEAKDKRDAFLACKESLEKALKEVGPAVVC